MALQLKRIGIDKVRPLEGGLDSWRQQGRTLQSGRIAVPLATDQAQVSAGSPPAEQE